MSKNQYFCHLVQCIFRKIKKAICIYKYLKPRPALYGGGRAAKKENSGGLFFIGCRESAERKRPGRTKEKRANIMLRDEMREPKNKAGAILIFIALIGILISYEYDLPAALYYIAAGLYFIGMILIVVIPGRKK